MGDITNPVDCQKVISQVDVVCHQAALGSVPRSVADPLKSHDTNVNGFLNMLNIAKENGIKRFIYASSSSVYGDDTHLPKQEDIIGKPMSPYAITKYINELYAYIFTKLYGMECIGLRYFNVFGPRQNPNGPYAAVIPKFVEALLNGESPVINGDGSFCRDFTYVNNVVMANVNALLTDNKECFGEAFNIGTNNNISILELYNLINDYIGNNIKPVFGNTRVGDVPQSLANIDKAKMMLKYNPTVTLKEGIIPTIEHFKSNL